MTERWERVKDLFHEALELAPGERAAFLRRACDDEDQRREVMELIEADARAENLLGARPHAYEASATSATASLRLPKLCARCGARYDAASLVCPADGEALVDDPEALLNTTLDGIYDVIELLGRGGFGVVYLARHVLLRDLVAIKLLPKRLSSDPDRVERFLREGRAARALHHPNAVAVYDLRASRDTIYMVQEYVEGRTLRAELDERGRIPAAEALDLLAPVASALDAAHAHGIVHRDLKPENIMIGSGGGRVVKLLDLGIAKLLELLVPTGGDVTQPGQIIGTPAYMPPEQWGEPQEDGGPQIDGRADVYGLAVVLYELVSGRRPFAQRRMSDLRRAHLLGSPPPLRGLVGSIPVAFERALERAMSKDRRLRQPTAGTLVAELRAALDGAAAEAGIATTIAEHPVAAAPPTARRRARSVAVAAALLAAGGGGALLVATMRQGPVRPAAPQASHFITRTGNCIDAATSADGKYVVSVVDDGEKRSLQITQVTTRAPRQIVPPTASVLFGPRFSPDGDYVFYESSAGGGPDTLYRVPANGGTPHLILVDVSSPVAFSPDGTRFAYVRDGPEAGQQQLMTANADGTDARPVAVRSAPRYFATGGPAWSPDGTTIACAAGEHGSGFRGDVVAVRVADGSEREIARPQWFYADAVAWLAQGDALVLSAQEQSLGPLQLWRISYPSGDATRITTDLNNYIGVSVTADSGSLVTVQTGVNSNVWVSRAGDGADAVQITSGVSRYYGVVWAPDGRIVYSSVASGNPDIWSMDSNGADARQLTVDDHVDRDPSVSPDGRYIFFSSNRAGPFNIWRMDADGANQVRLTNGSDEQFPFCSPDGRWVVYQGLAGGFATIWKVPIEGGAGQRLTDSYSNWPSVSKDGGSVACSLWDKDEKRWRGAVLSIDGGPPRAQFDVPVLVAPMLSWQRIRWAAEGRSLTYIDDRGGASNIWARPLDARPPRQVTAFRSERLFYYDFSLAGALVCTRGPVTSDVVSISGFGEPRR